VKNIKLLILLSFLPAALLAAKQPERKDIRTGNKEYKKGSYSEAELSYRRAMEKAPASANAKFNLGNALYKQVDSTMAQTAPDEAKQLQEQVRKLYENAAESYTNDQQKAAAHYNEGNTYLREQNWQAAIDAYKKSLRLNPNDIEAKQNLVFAQAMNNQQPPQQQQQQNQDKDKDKDKKDDKDKDKNKDQQQQDNQDQNKDKDKDKKDQQQQQQQEQKISKEDAQRMLQALEQQEKDTQEKVKREKAQKAQQRTTDKNW